MSEMELTKENIVKQLRRLCAHCSSGQGVVHRCAVKELALRVQSIRGVPLIVNDEFRGILSPTYR